MLPYLKKTTELDKTARVSADTLKCQFASLSDEEVWSKFKTGDEDAFIYIYRTYFQQLYQYGQQFTCDLTLIEDLIQDLLIELRKNRKTLGNAPSIKFYLFKSLRRKISRSHKHKKLIYFQDIHAFQSFYLAPPCEAKLMKTQLDQQKRTALEAAFQKLAPRQREAIYYYFFQEMSYEEVAAIMGLNHLKSARNLIYKAIDSLKKQLGPHKEKLLYFLFF